MCPSCSCSLFADIACIQGITLCFVADLMNAIYRVESDNSVDADEPIMKHMMEGGVTILKQLERKKPVCYLYTYSLYHLRYPVHNPPF